MFTVHPDHIENALNALAARIHPQDIATARRYLQQAIGKTFPTASEAYGYVHSLLWNSGLVK